MCGRRIEVDGVQGYIQDVGDGEPVVILSSTLIGNLSYQRTAAALRRRLRVILVELPGSGRGSRLPRLWPLERYGRWAADLLPALGVDGATVVGHSDSGAIALWLGVLHPERIRGLVLVDSVGASPSGSVPDVLIRRALEIPTEPRFDLWAAPNIAVNLVLHPRSFWQHVRLAATEDLTGVAARVRARTLVGWGARDHTMPLRDAFIYHRMIEGSTLYVSKDGGHDWLVERPDEFAAALTAFMARD